jgi:TatD DNase family protein
VRAVIDSHTHLGSTPGDNADIVARAREMGVTKILDIGMDADSSRLALAAVSEFEGTVYAAVGRHPNSAAGFTDADAAELAELATDPRCRAIGETGLDFYRDRASRADQERAFAAQIEIARDTGKPLVIHSRAADDDTITTLARDADGVTVILHCFSMADRLDECLEHGWYVSYAGNVTYPKSMALAMTAVRAPLDRLLVETDAPYLTPQIVRKERNQPANVVYTAEFIAEHRKLDYVELESAVEANAARLFGW